jgi:AAA15 family ATPase/GTPase
MFKSIAIKNFRGIKDLEILKTGKINVFVGTNDIGKTTVLDALFTTINPNNPALLLKTNIFREMLTIDDNFLRSYFYNFSFENSINISTSGSGVYERSIKIEPVFKNTYSIPAAGVENVRDININEPIQNKAIGLQINFKVANSKEHASSFQQNEKDIIIKGNDEAFSSTTDKAYDEQLGGHYFNSSTYGKKGNIVPLLTDLISDNKKQDLVSLLTQFEKNIVDINIISNDRVILTDKRFKRAVEIGTYGGGLLRAAHIFTNALASKRGIILFDEIENGLHITNQSLVWKAILQINKNKQIFAATHSKEMLKNFYNVAKENNVLEDVRLYRLQNTKEELSVVTYEPDQLEYAMTHDLEVR